MTEPQELPAGGFSAWLHRTRCVLAGEGGAEVPCGECNACCRSSLFIHIHPEEARTLARIPGELLFPAPGKPKGTVLLGYDEHGRCPMLIDGRCSIYEDRPLTCRTYDCRVFSAAGVAAGDEKALIAERTRRWRFGHPTKQDRDEHVAVQAAAKFLKEHAEWLPAGVVPGDSTQLAILALEVGDVFARHEDEPGKTGRATSDRDVAKAVVEAREKFEAGSDPPRPRRPESPRRQA
jgi:Fe-S-cluster containining protein